MDIQVTHLDIDQLISVAELPNKIKSFELKQNQNTLYNSFFDRAGTMYALIQVGLRMKQKILAQSKDLNTSQVFANLYFKNGSI
jgi:hypothetical protein